MALLRRTSSNSLDIWPGFVDALATLLMVIIFLLMIFVVAQFFLNDAIIGRDQALEKLNQQVEELADLLSLEKISSGNLRTSVSQLTDELKSTIVTRNALEIQLTELGNKHSDQKTQLKIAIAKLETARKKNTQQIQNINSLQEDVQKLILNRNTLTSQMAALRTKFFKQSEKAIAELKNEQKISEAAQAHVARLNRQMRELRKQIAQLNSALEASETESKEQKTQITSLGKRLNAALASKVQELARYRSEFFGQLRTVLGNRPDIQIVGDRFVFQSEVLFRSGSAEIGEDGKLQLAQLAKSLKVISEKIPKELDWVLRVDGHTDRLPIKTALFPSNWELSTARAISVVKFLIAQNIPARNLAATGFGEFRPLDIRNDEIAFRRNRRIELKLDQR